MQAQANGMQLYFISRHEYKYRADQAYLQTLQQRFPQAYIIPEGGTNSLAVTGCKEILSSQDLENYDVFCCAVGTGGTMSGLIEASSEQHQVLGFPVLKGNFYKQKLLNGLTKPTGSCYRIITLVVMLKLRLRCSTLYNTLRKLIVFLLNQSIRQKCYLD